jgi:hypothetical protein
LPLSRWTACWEKSGGRSSWPLEPPERAAMEHQRHRSVTVLDGVQPQEHDGVVSGLNLAVDRRVELG